MEDEETTYRNSLLRQTLDSQKEKKIIIGLAILCNFVAIIALSCTAIHAVISNEEQEQQLSSCQADQQASAAQCQQALEQLQEEIDLECTVDRAMERAVQRALQGRSE